jgi:hypothetical protein
VIGLSHRLLGRGIVLLAAGALALSAVGTASAADAPLPKPITHQRFDAVVGVLTGQGNGATGVSAFRNVSGAICSTTTSGAANVNTDCEPPAPHNETSIAVDPTDPQHLLGSVNDYQLRLS